MCESFGEVQRAIFWLTTGSKELAVYCASGRLKDRLHVRILPGRESLELCMEQGIKGRQILALQGPFSTEMNAAILRQYDIRHMVTKNSGRAGGCQEKLEAAKMLGIPVYVIELRRRHRMLPGIFRGQTRIRLQESVENWDNSVIVRFRSREVWKSALPGSVWAAETA